MKTKSWFFYPQDSEAILKDANIDQDIRTRGEQQRLQDITEEGKDDEPPRVPRDLTIKETTKVNFLPFLYHDKNSFKI